MANFVSVTRLQTFLNKLKTWIANTYVAKTGDTMTGDLTVPTVTLTSSLKLNASQGYVNYGLPSTAYNGGYEMGGKSGLNISQKADETSGISLNGDYIVLWSPADSYTLRYFDEDNGNELWNINATGAFSGSAAKLTTARTLTIGSTAKSFDGTANVSWTLAEIGAVPTTRTVNGKALSANITLTASDVGALPDTTTVPTKTSELTNDSGFAATKTYTATSKTSWTSSSDYYYQDITVSGLLATDNPIVSIVPTIDGHEDEWSAWASVFKITTSANTLRLYSDEAITIALSLQIKVVR